MRIDKYLWAVRLFKTRSLASKKCNGEHIKLKNELTKASRVLKIGDEFEVKVVPIWRSYRVIGFPKSRVGAQLVPDYLVETTDEDQLKELEVYLEMQRKMRQDGFRGRPTKRDRRKLDGFQF